MDGVLGGLFLSRVQFAFATAFHIMWPALSIGLAVFIVVVESLWVKTGDEIYYRHARFWSKLFVLVFAVGVVTGIPLGFQFGTNWQGFAAATGGFFGQIISFEAMMAFMLEAGFLGVMLFGWKRVSRGVHLFSTIMVTFGATLSAFWIMVANSWMQTPAGGHMENGRFVIDNYLAAVFNPDWFHGFTHMWVAALETTIFVVGGISAWKIMRGKNIAFFQKSFRIALFMAVVVAPLQFIIGDESGRLLAKIQPAKLAAIEAHWETNPPGEDAGWTMVAWPNRKEQKNDFQIKIPYGLSLLITHSLTGQVKGLKEFPPDEQPPVAVTYYAFRVMMGIGFFFIFLMLFTLYYWKKKLLTPDRIAEQKKPLFLWICALPLGFIAVITGWITREVGRQPWIVYGMVRTDEVATPLPAGAVGVSLLFFIGIYAVLFLVFLASAGRVVGQDPDQIPAPVAPKGGK